MADYEPALASNGLSRARFLGAALEAVGALIVVATLAWALERYWAASQSVPPAVGLFLSTTALLIASWGAGLLLWAAADVVRRLDVTAAAVQQVLDIELTRPRELYQGGGASERGPVEAGSNQEVAALLREIRDIALLNDAQRAARLETQGREAVRRMEAEVPALLREHNWIEARRRVMAARERFPMFSEWSEFEQRIEQTRKQIEARDVENVGRQIADLTAVGAWDRVSEALNDLLERHPNSPGAMELARKVARDRDKAEAEQRARLMSEAQAATTARDWRAALAAAQTLIQRFPKSPEAEALRLQIGTLRENAEIQQRQLLEMQIRDHIKQHRYADAIAVSEEVIEKFPNSPQAQALREQLPRLREKAEQAR